MVAVALLEWVEWDHSIHRASSSFGLSFFLVTPKMVAFLVHIKTMTSFPHLIVVDPAFMHWEYHFKSAPSLKVKTFEPGVGDFGVLFALTEDVRDPSISEREWDCVFCQGRTSVELKSKHTFLVRDAPDLVGASDDDTTSVTPRIRRALASTSSPTHCRAFNGAADSAVQHSLPQENTKNILQGGETVPSNCTPARAVHQTPKADGVHDHLRGALETEAVVSCPLDAAEKDRKPPLARRTGGNGHTARFQQAPSSSQHASWPRFLGPLCCHHCLHDEDAGPHSRIPPVDTLQVSCPSLTPLQLSQDRRCHRLCGKNRNSFRVCHEKAPPASVF